MPAFDPIGVGLNVIAGESGLAPIVPVSNRPLESFGFTRPPTTMTPGPRVPTPPPADTGLESMGFTRPPAPGSQPELRNAPADWLPQHPVAQFARSVNPFGLTDLAVAGTHVAGGMIDAARAGREYDAGADFNISLGQIERDRRNFAAQDPNLAMWGKGASVASELAAGVGADMVVGGLYRGARAIGGTLLPRRPQIHAPPPPAVPGLLETAVRGGVSSAALGATDAYTSAPPESSPDERFTRAAVGGIAGGGAGLVLAPVTQGIFDLIGGAAGTRRTFRQGREELHDTVAGPNAPITNPDEVGDMIHRVLETRIQQYRNEADQAYLRAGQLGAHVADGSAVGQNVLTRVQQSGVVPSNDPALAGSQEALELLQGLSRRRGAVPVAPAPVGPPSAFPTAGPSVPINPTGNTIGGDSLVDLQIRLNGIQARSPRDLAALTRIRQAWRETFDAMPATPGFIRDSNGVPMTGEAVGLIQMGNAAWGRMQRLANSDTVPGRIITAWREENKSATAIANDMLTLASSPKTVSDAVQVFEHLRRELSAEQINALQQGLLIRQLGGGGVEATPKQVRNNLYRLVDGDARVFGQAVFTPQQQNAIRAFYRAIPQGTQNLAVASAGRHGLAAAAGGLLAYFGFKAGATIGSADAISNTVSMGGGLTGLFTGLAAGEYFTGKLRRMMIGDVANPVLVQPLLSQRIGRGAGIAVGANAGGVIAETPPDKLQTLLPY